MRTQKSFSTYLDLVRFLAAILVVLEHGVLLGVLPSLGLLSQLSHEAVVVFFVLSGLVIAASTASKNTTAADYVANRAARIYSVALPAVVCCYAALLMSGGPAAAMANVPARFLSSFLFLDGVWLNYGSVPFNGPYWSLCYEAWYYALWAIVCFVRRPWLRMTAAGLVLCAMGPALAALAGIWLLGALLAKQWDCVFARIERAAAVWLAVAALVALLIVCGSPLQETIHRLMTARIHGWWRLRGSELMVTDYAIGALVAIHLAAVGAWFGNGRRLHDSPIGSAIRYCAGFTFTLYLFHYPMLLLFKAVGVHASFETGAGVFALTVAGAWLVAFATERQLPRWRRLMKALVTLAVPDGRPIPGAAPSFTRS